MSGVQRGTTLVEVLAALALASFLAVGLMMLYDSAANGYAGLGTAADCQYTARAVMELIRSDIHTATAVQISASGSMLELTTSDREIRFYRQDGTLYRRIRTARGVTAIPVAENVREVVFGASDGLVMVTLCVGGEGRSRSLITAAAPRLGSKQP